MLNVYAVTYRCKPDLNRSYPQNANRHIAIKLVKGWDAALAFAATVPAVHIVDYCGKTVKKF